MYKSISKITNPNILKAINENAQLFDKLPAKLMTIDGDAKTIKGDKLKVKTGIIYLAPSNTLNFYNTCPMAKLAGCEKACLYSAGRGKFTSVQLSRIRKTLYWIDRRDEFLTQLKYEIMFVGWEGERSSHLPNSNMVSYLWVASLWLFVSGRKVFARAQNKQPRTNYPRIRSNS